MSKTYTKQELIKKYSGKFIETYRTFDYSEQRSLYEVRRVSKVIRENCNPPEDLQD